MWQGLQMPDTEPACNICSARLAQGKQRKVLPEIEVGVTSDDCLLDAAAHLRSELGMERAARAEAAERQEVSEERLHALQEAHAGLKATLHGTQVTATCSICGWFLAVPGCRQCPFMGSIAHVKSRELCSGCTFVIGLLWAWAGGKTETLAR